MGRAKRRATVGSELCLSQEDPEAHDQVPTKCGRHEKKTGVFELMHEPNESDLTSLLVVQGSSSEAPHILSRFSHIFYINTHACLHLLICDDILRC